MYLILSRSSCTTKPHESRTHKSHPRILGRTCSAPLCLFRPFYFISRSFLSSDAVVRRLRLESRFLSFGVTNSHLTHLSLINKNATQIKCLNKFNLILIFVEVNSVLFNFYEFRSKMFRKFLCIYALFCKFIKFFYVASKLKTKLNFLF